MALHVEDIRSRTLADMANTIVIEKLSTTLPQTFFDAKDPVEWARTKRTFRRLGR
jgi:hypothetical protein